MMDLINMIPETLQLIIAGLSLLSAAIIGAVAVKHLLSKLPADKVSNFATAALIHALWPLTYFGEAATLHGTAGKTIFLALLLTPVGWPVAWIYGLLARNHNRSMAEETALRPGGYKNAPR